MKNPKSFVLFIAALCLISAGVLLTCLPFHGRTAFWLLFTFILLGILSALTGLITGLLYHYAEDESKLLNRIGWTGNLVFVTVLLWFIFIVAFSIT